MADETTTLFTYANGYNWTTYNDVSFTPVFFNPNLTAMFGDATGVAEAETVCNGGAVDTNPEARRECYFDFLVTANQAAAAATVAAAGALAEETSALNNFAPVVANANVSLHVSQEYKIYHTLDTGHAEEGTREYGFDY